jgi:hypothetical protein
VTWLGPVVTSEREVATVPKLRGIHEPVSGSPICHPNVGQAFPLDVGRKRLNDMTDVIIVQRNQEFNV